MTCDGLRAEVTRQAYLFTPEQWASARASGISLAVLEASTRPVTEPCPVREVLTLVAPTDQARRAVQVAGAAIDFAVAVAGALDRADTPTLRLLAEHPELAGFLAPGGAPDRVAGDTALAFLMAHSGPSTLPAGATTPTASSRGTT